MDAASLSQVTKRVISLGSTIVEARGNIRPLFVLIEVDTLHDAISVVNANKYGNGAAIFTQSGATALKFESELNVGRIGVNVPIPQFSWSGNKASFLGDVSFYGKQGLDFYTQDKTIMSLWRAEDAIGNKAR